MDETGNSQFWWSQCAPFFFWGTLLKKGTFRLQLILYPYSLIIPIIPFSNGKDMSVLGVDVLLQSGLRTKNSDFDVSVHQETPKNPILTLFVLLVRNRYNERSLFT